MPGWFGPRLQSALVVVLFLGSLSALAFNLIAAALLPRRDAAVRGRLREAGRRMCERAEALAERRPSSPEELNGVLRQTATRVLTDFPGVEGGLYLAEADRFAGAAFPTEERREESSLPRNDPPPLEAPLLRVQARQSLDLGLLLSTRDVGPSRVVFLTQPVGERRPARLVVWVMFRLRGPEDLSRQLSRYAFSLALALGGVALSLALTWNLGRTLRRQRREEERLRDELRRAEQLAALGRLLAGVAHEVRNPLAGIRSTVQLWKRLPESARTPASLEAVIRSVDRLDAIVARLLYFSRADNADRSPVDLNQILRESLDLLAAQARLSGVVLEANLSSNLPPVGASANALRQVALNLLGNAMQAMPGGGRLVCSTRPLPEQGMVEFRVADTGRGISEENRRRLFEPFFTTRPDGTGLGLALCREIVHGHGGRIELESTSASGSVFRVLLPIASP
jgi:signal transduction histidine kinase